MRRCDWLGTTDGAERGLEMPRLKGFGIRMFQHQADGYWHHATKENTPEGKQGVALVTFVKE